MFVIIILYIAMLRWFVDPKIVEAVLRKPKGVSIEDQVGVRPKNLQMLYVTGFGKTLRM